jgi:hypothetical protein
MMRRQRNRGTTLLFIIAITAIAAAFCAQVLLRSVDQYRSSAMAERRLQAAAALEGALVILADDPAAPHDDEQFDGVTVRFGDLERDNARLRVPVRIEIYRSGDSPLETVDYSVVYTLAGEKWKLASVERLP